MPFSSCPMSVARFAMPPHRCCMTHKRLWAAPLHRFWIQIPAISPSRLLRRKAGLNGTWERLRTFFYSSLFLYFCCKVRKLKRSQSDNTGKTTSTDGTQHQIVQQLYILHMFLMFLFWIFLVSIHSVAPTGSCIGPGWDRPTEASEPQLRTKKSTSVTRHQTACPTNRQSCCLFYNNKK